MGKDGREHTLAAKKIEGIAGKDDGEHVADIVKAR